MNFFLHQMILMHSLGAQLLTCHVRTDPQLRSEGTAWCLVLQGWSAGQPEFPDSLQKAAGDSFLLGFQRWQMGPHCFKVSVWKIQTSQVNLHFKVVVFEENYASNEKPVWSSGFSMLALAGPGACFDDKASIGNLYFISQEN